MDPSEKPQPTVADVIRFEAAHPHLDAGRKVIAIRQVFGWTGARYFLTLAGILDNEAALAEALEVDAITTNRLLEARAARAEARRQRVDAAPYKARGGAIGMDLA